MAVRARHHLVLLAVYCSLYCSGCSTLQVPFSVAAVLPWSDARFQQEFGSVPRGKDVPRVAVAEPAQAQLREEIVNGYFADYPHLAAVREWALTLTAEQLAEVGEQMIQDERLWDAFRAVVIDGLVDAHRAATQGEMQ